MNTFSNKLDHDDDEYGYDNLCKYSIEKCELCDMVFSSRFANIIHSSQHIIIPLLKQKIHQCKKCLYCFTSKPDLKAHKQDKHTIKDINVDNDQQIGHMESRIGQEESQTSLGTSQKGHERSQIYNKESEIVIDHEKSETGEKKSQNSHKKRKSDHKESQNSHNESENEKDALLLSIIMKQPIVKVDNIANLFAKQLLPTKNDKKHTKLEKDSNILQKDSPNIAKDNKNKEKDNANTHKYTKLHEKESLKNKKVDKAKSPSETILSSNQTSQISITEVIPTKIIIGGKKPLKRKSPDKTDSSLSKREKKSTSTDTNKSERDIQSEATVTNGTNTTKLTGLSTNRYRFDYRALSPDVISIKSDSSDEVSSERNLPIAAQSKRKLLAFTYEEGQSKTVSQKDQSKNVTQKEQSKNVQQNDWCKTVSQKDQSKTVPQKKQSKNVQQNDWSKNISQKDQSKTVPQKDQSKNIQKSDWSKNVSQKDQSKTQPQNEQSKNIQKSDWSKNVSQKDQSKTQPQNEQSKNIQQNDWSKNLSQKNQSINIPLVITESDDELDANIDELLNNITSPVKKSNFRSKLQFEDDENIKLLDLDRELTNLTYEFKSIHYDELVEPELSECRRCHMIFMNKLTLYKHELTHMRFKRSKKHFFCKYCENYYAGNHFSQKKHFDIVHNSAVDNKRIFPCPICKLQYHKLKEHYRKFHPNLICKFCSTCFGTETVMHQHNCTKTMPETKLYVDSTKNYDLILVCELCLSFTKNTANFKYEVVGEKCEIGTRQKCFYCSKEFFEAKVVKRINFMTLIKSQNLKNNDLKVSEGKKKGQVSNAVKLQMIKKRLKAMKK